MQPSTRTSIGFLLVGLLGVLVGAVIVACVPGKILNNSSTDQSYTASASAIHNTGDPDLEQRCKEASPARPGGVLRVAI